MDLNNNIIEKHNAALVFLDKIVAKLYEKINTNITIENDFFSDIYCDHLKFPNNLTTQHNMLKKCVDILHFYNSIENKNKKKYSHIKKQYNANLNKLHSIVKPNSILNDLCFLSNDLLFVKKQQPKFKNHTDILTLDQYFGPNIGTLKLSIGRIFFDNPNDLLYCLLAYIEQSTIDDLTYITIMKNTPIISNNWGILKQNNVIFVLNIKFPHTQTDDDKQSIQQHSIIPSNSQKILHYLCNGLTFNQIKLATKKIKKKHMHVNMYDDMYDNMTPEQQIKYNLYYKYQCAVRQRITQLIRMNYNNQSFPYQIIDCVRFHPIPCRKQHILLKPHNDNKTKSKKHVCDCKMELCVGGCCRIYHGESDCTFSLDEASECAIKLISDKCSCPKCKAPVERSEGCNHMTCFCKTQFCYTCKQEFEKDKYNKYMISEHFRDNDVGRTLNTSCRQFS